MILDIMDSVECLLENFLDIKAQFFLFLYAYGHSAFKYAFCN